MYSKPHPLLAACAAVVLLSVSAPADARAQSVPASNDAAAGSVAPTADFEAVRRVIRQVLEEAKVPSIAVAIVKDGRIVWEEAFGWADVERRVPATPSTAYSLASMTKPITATAVMTLRDAGRLDIDAPIENYLGGVRLTGHAGDTHQVTARRIMSHSAGLPQYGNFYLDGSRPAGSAETISRFGLVVFPPDTRFEYSNIGMKILDAAIEQVSGRSFADYLRGTIFEPLGMSHSAVGLPPGVDAAVRYDAERRPMGFYLTDHPGSGDVWASAHDVARFLAYHMGAPLPDQRPILSGDTRREMQRPASAHPMPTGPGEPRRDIGANWIISTSNGHPQIWHSGGQPGVSTFMAFYPDQRLGIVLLANASAPLGRIGEAIRATVAPELIRAEAEQAPSPPTAPPFRGTWLGVVTHYAGQQAIALSFDEEGQATVAFDGQAAVPVSGLAFENGALTGRFTGVSSIPEAGRSRHGLTLKLILDGSELIGPLMAQGMDETTVFMLPSFVRLRPSPRPVGRPAAD